MNDPDPFDEIVQHLDLDWDVPDAQPTPAPEPAVPPAVDINDPEAEPFYRQVERREPKPHRLGVLLAWSGILAGPITIMLVSIIHLILPRPLLLGLGLVFVAGAIYLVSQLPDHGPSDPYWPDDGAQL